MAKTRDKDFYIDEIKVCEWLESKDEKQIHRFSDRVEYKKNYKLHREDGPAIEFHNRTNPKYYVEGIKYTDEEFKNYNRLRILNDIL